MLRFLAEMNDKSKFEIKNVLSFELTRSVDAACDGLRLTFNDEELIDEINKIYLYDDENIIFNGYVDTQRMSTTSIGYTCFIYARSSGAMLIDNEAAPISYNKPSLNSLYYKNAFEYGFNLDIPNMVSNGYYEVFKGTSCYAAINNFVKCLTNKNIYVDSCNNIKLLECKSDFNVPTKKVISEKKIINRSNAISLVSYKLAGDEEYFRNLRSDFLKDKGINRKRLVSIGTLPDMQKDIVAKNKLENSCEDYYTCEISLAGFHNANLCDRLQYFSKRLGIFDDYYLSKIVYSKSKDGVMTKICANKKVDLKEINYVD